MTKKHALNSYYYVLLGLAFLLSLHPKFIPPVIILLSVIALFLFKPKEIFKTRVIMAFLAFYVLHIIGLAYTNDLNAGIFDLQVKLSILIFPISLFPISQLPTVRLNRVYEFFVIGCLVAIFICVNIAFWNYTYERWAIKQSLYSENLGINFFLSSRVSYFMHPSYFAMYLGFAVAILLYKPSGFFTNVFLRYGTIVILSISIIFLASKLGILLLVLLLSFFLFSFKSKKMIAAVLVLFVGVFIALISFSTEFANKFKNMTSAFETTKVDQTSAESSAARVLIWESTTSLIKQSPLIGYGTGGVKKALNKKYEESGYTGVLSHELNAHNQLLQSTLALGIFGLISILLIFYYAFKEFSYSKSKLGKMLLIILFVNFMVESMLETQAGVVFFAFWILFELFIQKSDLPAANTNTL